MEGPGHAASYTGLAPGATKRDPAAVITLHTMAGTNELESLSPFCMKVEVYLKLQGLPYEAKNSDPRKAPKGKAPWIDDDGKHVADSSAIIAYLEKKSKTPLDAKLSAEQRARAHVLKRTFEESLYWVILWSAWADDEGWAELRTHIERVVPAAVRWFLPGLIRKKVVASSVAQGTGRHTRDEIYALGRADLEALDVLLGDRPYFLGDEMTTIDVTAYAFLARILLWPKASPLTDAARALPRLDAFVKRMADRVKAGKAAAAA
jgi:glutathione S-transferase